MAVALRDRGSRRALAGAPVSTPVTWEEIDQGVDTADFTIVNIPARLAKVGDLWKLLLAPRGRFRLEAVL